MGIKPLAEVFQGLSWASKSQVFFRTFVLKAYVNTLLCLFFLTMLPFIMDRSRRRLLFTVLEALLPPGTTGLLPHIRRLFYHKLGKEGLWIK